MLGAWANYAVAAIFFLVGLHLLDVIPLPFSRPESRHETSRPAGGVPSGLIFGIALGPCTFAYMPRRCWPSASRPPPRSSFAVLLITFYGMGHCGVIVAAGTFTEVVQRYLNWNEKSHGA